MRPEVSTSIQSFLLGLGVLSFFFVPCDMIKLLQGFVSYNFAFDHLYNLKAALYVIGFSLFINVWIYILFKGYKWEIAVRSAFLGTCCGIGIILSFIGTNNYDKFGWYIITMSIFHFSEYLSTALFNPSTLSLDSFLLNHSISYWLAAFVSWMEFFLEMLLFPKMKTFLYISLSGVFICMAGEAVRKLSMYTAGTNFNHVVQVNKQPDHKLVTRGIYRIFRHPSYVGWFYWSIGTQVILMNPICFVTYGFVSWWFFKQRIVFEEMTLIKFFGQRYINYQKRTKIWLPFISGFDATAH